MTIAKGTKLGPYEILSPLGAGGMGEVYRARDTRLDREVAVKVLPASFANDGDRLLRFEQEARATSALNHPNILTVHDFGTHEGSPYIVAELLEGEELRAQLNDGALAPRRALDYAQQIAAGLAAAHGKSITHRDLKPENLFITTDGRVKILDFGLAKLKPPKLAPGSSSEVATQKAITDAGTVMGTVGYMSPEQVRGQEADHRSDIFSFGVILYEMLSGKRTFTGDSAIEVMNAILKAEPEELTETNSKVGPALERIVHRCLEKKPERRFQSASDLCFAIEALSLPSGSRMETAAVLPELTDSRYTIGESQLFGNSRLGWLAAAVCLLVALTALPFAVAYFRRAPAEAEAVRFSISAPEEAAFLQLALSPDGRRVAMVILSKGQPLLWVRPLNAVAAQPLRGTEGAAHPFWSPDSRFIGFFAGGKLKKIELSGGPPQPLCEAPGQGRGGAWNREGVIVFASGPGSGLYRVSAAGGATTPVTKLDPGRQETAHRWPHFLPDGRHFLYSASAAQLDNHAIYAGSLDTEESTQVLAASSNAQYAPVSEGGYLFFVRAGVLMAQPFDAQQLKLKGEQFHVAEQVKYNPANDLGFFSVSENGALAYDPSGINQDLQLTWFDRAGKQLGVVGASGNLSSFALSPDDKRVAVTRIDAQSGQADIWLYDLERDRASRFTFDPAFDDFPLWSPDGSRVAFRSNRREGNFDLYQKLASGAGQDELLLKSDLEKRPTSWSSDGRFIAYYQIDPKTKEDVWVLPLFGGQKPFPLVQTEFNEVSARLSPDLKWIAYTSNESGKPEIYVQPFPAGGGRWQVSKDGGTTSRWRRDGKEIFYIGGGKVMAVAVKGSATFEVGTPQPLFDSGNLSPIYAVTGDGQRFLFSTPVEEAQSAQITVVLNWTAEVKR